MSSTHCSEMIKGADVSFVGGVRGRGGLLIRLVRRAVTLS
jgi:hypothetical protein